MLLKPLSILSILQNYGLRAGWARCWRCCCWRRARRLVCCAPNQRLLSRVEIKGVAQADKERLTALAQQKPNTRFPLPKLAIYHLGHNFYDSV